MKRLRIISKFRRTLIFLDKREKFAIQTILLTGGLLVTQLIGNDFRIPAILLLSFASYILTAWSLTEDIEGFEWLFLFILPVSFTFCLALFYYLLPARWIVRLTTTGVFAIGTYAILLVENIYNVAAVRSIQLLRVAQSVGLLLTLTVVFLLATVIYSLHLPFYLNFVLFLPLIFLLSLQSLWSVQLDEKMSRSVLLFAGIISYGIGKLALGLSFWPVGNTSYSLLVTAGYYSLVSIVQYYFLGRLFRDSIREYIVVFVFTLFLTFLVANWGG